MGWRQRGVLDGESADASGRLLAAQLRLLAAQARGYDPAFPIRGLVFDRRHGVLLKLSYAHSISPGTAFVGRRQLGEAELHDLYGKAMHV